MADPRRTTPEEHGEAHALLVRVVTDPDWQAASQALDDLMGKLLVIRRLLEAEERLPKREPRAASRLDVTAAVAQTLHRVTGPPVRAVSAWPPRRSRPLLQGDAISVFVHLRGLRGHTPWPAPVVKAWAEPSRGSEPM